MAARLPGEDAAFFFRQAEQDHLVDRLKYPGITVVSGRPRSGKSWLVGRVLRRVIEEDSPATLVGFARCSAQDSDNLLRVIDDLYTRWREQAKLLDQARELFEKSRGNWPRLVASAIASVVDAAQPFEGLSGIVGSALQGLTGLQAGARVPRLKYEQGQQLVTALAEIARADRLILVLDQWEQSASLDYELEHLRNFVRDCDDWPDTHFLVTIRPGGKAEDLLDSLAREQPGFVDCYPLPPFDTESDHDERERLVGYLRDKVPACRATDDPQQYLEALQGYAGVLDNWTRRINREQMRGLGELLEVARAAQEGRYPEFADEFPQLDDACRQLCIRLALLPGLEEQDWPSLSPILMSGAEPGCLDDLLAARLLEENDPPSFGHQSRSDYLQRWLLEQRKNETREQCTVLVRELAAEIRDTTPAILPFGSALFSLAIRARQLDTEILTQGLCEAAESLFGQAVPGDAIRQASVQLCKGGPAGGAALISMGLVNALAAAGPEDAPALLEELRALQQAHPEDGAVREQLANGLVNTLAAAGSEDAPALLEELRRLVEAYPAGDFMKLAMVRALLILASSKLAGEQRENESASLLREGRELLEGVPDETAHKADLLEVLEVLQEEVEGKENH